MSTITVSSATSKRICGLVVKVSASRAAEPGSIPAFSVRIFFGSSRTGDFKLGTPVPTLPGAWRYGVSAGTDWSGVSIL